LIKILFRTYARSQPPKGSGKFFKLFVFYCLCIVFTHKILFKYEFVKACIVILCWHINNQLVDLHMIQLYQEEIGTWRNNFVIFISARDFLNFTTRLSPWLILFSTDKLMILNYKLFFLSDFVQKQQLELLAGNFYQAEWDESIV